MNRLHYLNAFFVRFLNLILAMFGVEFLSIGAASSYVGQ